MNIKISGVQQDTKSLLTKKTLQIGEHKFETPFKLLDFNDSPSVGNISSLNQDCLNKIDLIEKSQIIRQKTFKAEVYNPDANFLYESYESFKKINILKNKSIINSLTFDFDPLQIDKYKDYISSFLYIYHGRSDVLLIPNLKVIKYEYPFLFNWDELAINNEMSVINLLYKLGINWNGNLNFQKMNNGKVIKFNEQNSLSLRLDDEKNQVYLKINDETPNKFSVKRENGKLNIYGKPVKVIKVPLNNYLDYVDIAYNNLDFKNSKPIFVPLPLKYGVKNFIEVLNNYLDKGYRYFWLDFEGGSSFSKSPFIRAYHERIERTGLIDKVVLYASNISRELNPDSKQIECVASDILASPLGVDIIGVNRAPQRGGYIKPLPKEEIINHKARFLDRENYYYVRYSDFKRQNEFFKKYTIGMQDIQTNPKFYSNFANTFEINDELNHHRNIMLEEKSLIEYLSGKKSIPPQKMKDFNKIITGKASPNAKLSDFI